MKETVHLLVFDGLADWEPAHALCELSRSGNFEVRTVGFTRQPVTTMAGLKVEPELAIMELTPQNSALLLLPGGDMWQDQGQPVVQSILQQFRDQNVPIAAICGATLEIARARLTQGRRHTSNALSYLKSMVPDYGDEAFYVDELAVSDGGVITASGLGAVEFAREIFRLLQVYDENDLRTWYDMFKHGLMPASMA